MTVFPFGETVQHLRRIGSEFDAPVPVSNCGVAPREQDEGLADAWPPIRSGRVVYAPYDSEIHAGDRLVINEVTYDVDDEPAQWRNPYTGREPGLVVLTYNLDDLFPTVVSVRTYLGSGSLGRVWADPVNAMVYKVERRNLDADADSSQSQTDLELRAAPLVGDVPAEDVFTPESIVTIGTRKTQVVTAETFMKNGVTAWVEVTCK